MSAKPVVIIFGAGANIGASLVKKFLGASYRVATVSRSAPEHASPTDDSTKLAVRADLYEPSQIPGVFDAVRKAWGTSPKVVIWNVGPVTPSPDQSNIFSIPVSAINRDVAVTVTSAFVAAGEAVKGWQGTDIAGRFIMTGNIQPKMIVPMPDFTTLGMTKSASAYWTGQADALYKDKNWR
jgi:NAD(P)-dependent dehydrogenase (short-subunit alcohol dehydrogenase family)